MSAPSRVEDLGEVVSSEDIVLWRQKEEGFFTGAGSEDGPRALKKGPKARLATHALLCALDNALLVSTGRGLLFFPPGGCDQGSDNWAAVWFLQFALDLRLATIVDTCHRTPNDCKLADVECGWWSFVLTMVPVYNLHWGPWKGCKWQQDAKQALVEMGSFVKPSGQFFSWIAQRIRRDFGCFGRAFLGRLGLVV